MTVEGDVGMDKNEVILKSIQDQIDLELSKFKGKKISIIKEKLNFPTKNDKASFVKLARLMMRISNNKIEIDGQQIILKTIRLTGTGAPAESMSFMPVNFEEWIEEKSWEESSLYKYFRNNKLLFFIFQQYPSGKRVDDSEMTFVDAKVWKMSEYDLNHGLKEIWQEVRRLVSDNNIEIKEVRQKNGRIINKNNLPSQNFNLLGHLRPGAVNGNDKIMLPTGQMLVKQRFWFNSDYVKKIIDEEVLNR